MPGALSSSDPPDWLVTTEDFERLRPNDVPGPVKRAIGWPGDHVACCDDRGRITVYGVALNEVSYGCTGNSPSATPFSVTVPHAMPALPLVAGGTVAVPLTWLWRRRERITGRARRPADPSAEGSRGQSRRQSALGSHR